VHSREFAAESAFPQPARELLDHFARSSDTRMRRIEENLDALIRAITAEHSNGKATR
jgi:hypothetical protein